MSNMSFLQNLQDIFTFKKYARFFIKASEIVLDGMEPSKIHISSRYATYLNLVLVFKEFSKAEHVTEFLKSLRDSKIFKDSASN